MFVIAVANSKGGCGKTTLATHLAARFAARGFGTGLADLDRQQSARAWLTRRPTCLAMVQAVEAEALDGKRPKGLDRLVVDCPAAMTKDTVRDLVRSADAIVVPVLPSVFDEDGTRRFLRLLMKLKPIQRHRRDVLFVANRARSNTRAADRLDAFLGDLDFPAVARLRETAQYANAAAEGRTIFESGGMRADSYRAEWLPLFNALERAADR